MGTWGFTNLPENFSGGHLVAPQSTPEREERHRFVGGPCDMDRARFRS
jgi:hypothetical protein